MAGACQMKASKSAVKSTHTFPFSPSLSGCVSVHCLLALWQHIVHSAECSGLRYIRDLGKGRSKGRKTGMSKCFHWSPLV